MHLLFAGILNENEKFRKNEEDSKRYLIQGIQLTLDKLTYFYILVISERYHNLMEKKIESATLIGYYFKVNYYICKQNTILLDTRTDGRQSMLLTRTSM